ncbi:MAG: response regulator transcription factor [Candidatus Levybacteria bacterium]|nr:response regulator transcription factor [Candidatus Levybacteria bacterium]
MRVIIIEDEQRLSNTVKNGLSEEGFAVDQAFDGKEGQYLAQSETYDLIILDLMLPKVDGVTVCKNLRAKNIKTPIIMLTAKSRLEEKVEGLDAGADDYLTKPFAFEELRSRIQALLRRSHNQAENVLNAADLTVNPIKHTVQRSGKKIILTPKEFSILEYLLRHKDELVTRTQIIEHAWDYNFDNMSNVVDVFINTLRKKVDGGSKTKLIHTIHGVGYKLGVEG